MCEGEKRKLSIPSELGYGDRGAPPKIPGENLLRFFVCLKFFPWTTSAGWIVGSKAPKWLALTYCIQTLAMCTARK